MRSKRKHSPASWNGTEHSLAKAFTTLVQSMVRVFKLESAA